MSLAHRPDPVPEDPTDGSPSATLRLSMAALVGKERDYVAEVLNSDWWAGGGRFAALCAEEIKARTGAAHAFLTHSCTASLEIAAILADLEPGDEVIMPSFTFVSTASAVVLRGAVPVFVDIRPDTLNLDERQIEAAITPRTRAIIAVHYAGVCCEMDAIVAIARRHGLLVIEDAAHAYLSSYRGRPAGALGDMGAISFHETKNVICGEGGAFTCSRPDLAVRAETVRDKGTERARFMRGEIDKYRWVDLGSSYTPAEVVTAVLYAQLEFADAITLTRLGVWDRYHERFADAEKRGRLRRPIVPPECGHNGHIYYLLLEDEARRDKALQALKAEGIGAAFHYVPLHSSPAGERYGRIGGAMQTTDQTAARLLRLPIHAQVTQSDVERVAAIVEAAI
jgi:dTDP-4-amino-4,6-dideoxygalactose transaminase